MSGLSEDVSILRGVPLFAGLDPARLKLLAFACDRLEFEPGQELFREGDPARGAYVILAGEAALSREGASGRVAVGRAGPGDVLGEGAILAEGPRETTARALTPVAALRITREHFRSLMACCPKTMTELLRALGERTRQPIA